MITVRRTAPANSKYRPRSVASKLSRIGRICRPMKMKASTFSMKTTVSHTAYDGMRSRAGMRSGAVRATAMAKHTMVSTPERPIRSASIQTPNVVTNWRMMAVGTSCTRSVQRSVSHASAGPATTLPATANRKAGATAPKEKP